MVEIAKALALNSNCCDGRAKCNVDSREVEGLYQIVDELGQGIGIIYISHRLDEIDRRPIELWFSEMGRISVLVMQNL